MASYDSIYRLGAAQALTVASAGGAANSTTAFSSQTYAIQISWPGSTSSTSGCRVVVDGVTAANSVSDALIPPNWIQEIKVTPGQRLSAISNDAGTFSLSVTELTK